MPTQENCSAYCFLFYFFFKNNVGGGGGNPNTNTYLMAKLKVSVFENGQFSGHLIFEKKNFFFRRKQFFYPNKQELWFKEKKYIFLFLKKNVFFGNVFSKKLKKIFDKFLVGRKVLEILEKKFSKKHFQKNIFFFQKNKVFVYRE